MLHQNAVYCCVHVGKHPGGSAALQRTGEQDLFRIGPEIEPDPGGGVGFAIKIPDRLISRHLLFGKTVKLETLLAGGDLHGAVSQLLHPFKVCDHN